MFLFLPNSYGFRVDSGKHDLSFATEYCLISHKSLDGEKMSPKYRNIYLKF